jgi:chemotaxis protein methyltransferase CheR
MRTRLDPDDVARFRDLVRERVGLAFPHSRLADVERAVQKAVAETALPDAGALFRLLMDRARSREALDTLISALNVGETHFLRDQAQIQALEERILPDIIARRRPQRRLRVWSAACSTGEEAYTLAILVHQQLLDLAEWDVRILATDVNGRALERASRGVYGPWSFRGVPPHVKRAYFVRDGDRYRVAPRIRAMVSFEQANLVDGVPLRSPADPWKVDLILCRNVLQYFDGETAQAVVGRLMTCLDGNGWILLSQVEAALGGFDGLDAQGCGAFRKAPPAPAETPLPGSPPHRPAVPPARAGSPPSRPTPRPATSAEATEVPASYQEALRLWREDRPQEALRRLRLEGSRAPLAASLHYLQGLILLDEGQADQALAAFRRCTFADPCFALGHLAQANLLTRAGSRSRAMTALENAARLVADLDPAARVFPGDELRAGAMLELVDAQRQLLRPRAEREVVDG